jgi:hypothetical protein
MVQALPDPKPSKRERRPSFAELSMGRAMAVALSGDDEEAEYEDFGAMANHSPKRGDVHYSHLGYTFVNEAHDRYDGVIQDGELEDIAFVRPMESLRNGGKPMSFVLKTEEKNEASRMFLMITLSAAGWGYDIFQPAGFNGIKKAFHDVKESATKEDLRKLLVDTRYMGMFSKDAENLLSFMEKFRSKLTGSNALF